MRTTLAAFCWTRPSSTALLEVGAIAGQHLGAQVAQPQVAEPTMLALVSASSGTADDLRSVLGALAKPVT